MFTTASEIQEEQHNAAVFVKSFPHSRSTIRGLVRTQEELES